MAIVTDSGIYDFGPMGKVRVTVRRNSRSIRARWSGGAIVLSTPPGIGLSKLTEVLGDFWSRLSMNKPGPKYHDGQIMTFESLRIEIGRQSHRPDKILASVKMRCCHIAVGTYLDFGSSETMECISKMICRIARRMAPDILLPDVRRLAEATGTHPSSVAISHGHRTLGRCSSRGEVSLSYMLVFLPSHLRDYVICHELAHLSEMNHSARFHEICDSYCSGNEKRWEAELKRFDFPIVR